MLSMLDVANVVIYLEATLLLPFLVSLVPLIWSSMLPLIPALDLSCYEHIRAETLYLLLHQIH